MCGILGLWRKNGLLADDKEKIKLGLKKLKPRGPDFTALAYFGENLAKSTENSGILAHTRLAILDLNPRSNQPMFFKNNEILKVNFSEDSIESSGINIAQNAFCADLCLVFNGEIYNFIEIKEILQKNGFKFHTNSDSEVLLAAYCAWGERCVQKFNGSFAFCIFDYKKQRLFFARDRFGKKPFFYYYDGVNFIFASEIKAILGFVKRNANIRAIVPFIVRGNIDCVGNETFFENIFRVPQSHFGILNLKDFSLHFEKYYEISSTPKLYSESGEQEVFDLSKSLSLSLCKRDGRMARKSS